MISSKYLSMLNSGTILIDGKPVYENPEVKQRIAYIPDELYYFAQASTETMKKYYQALYPGFDTERFEKLRKYFPSINTKTPIRRLSKGMQKQALFWLSLCCRPDLLILDEPVDGLDPVMRRQIWSLIMADAAERDLTVLISSHNLRELEDVCDHVGIMHKGRFILEQSLSELQEGFSKVRHIITGGKERYDSSYAGILECPNSDYVFIHDAARPYITEEILIRTAEEVQKHLAVAVGVPSKDTIKIVDDDGFVTDTPLRKNVWNIQTPQAFSYSLIRAAYEIMLEEGMQGITDDAMVVEASRLARVKLVMGAYTNIKITTPDDLK